MKNAVITGSSKGLGKSIASKLSEAGYRVWLSGRSEEALQQTKEEIEALSNNPVEIDAIDLSNRDECKSYAESLIERCGRIDILVNNAGIFLPDQLTQPERKLEEQMNLNFYAAYTITQTLLPGLCAQKEGHIFNICSAVNRQPRAEAASYTISKFALWGYHEVLHKSMLPHGVKVTALFPGSINTTSWEGMNVPRKEFIQPEDIADLILNLSQMRKGTVPSRIDLAAQNPEY